MPADKTPQPYRVTPIFDDVSLPAALRASHHTKAGVWGVVRMIEGRLKLTYLDPFSEIMLDAENPGMLRPQQPHFVTSSGPMKMRVEFYTENPSA